MCGDSDSLGVTSCFLVYWFEHESSVNPWITSAVTAANSGLSSASLDDVLSFVGCGKQRWRPNEKRALETIIQFLCKGYIWQWNSYNEDCPSKFVAFTAIIISFRWEEYQMYSGLAWQSHLHLVLVIPKWSHLMIMPLGKFNYSQSWIEHCLKGVFLSWLILYRSYNYSRCIPWS